MVKLNPEPHRRAKMQLLSSSALKSLSCSVWLICAKHVLADGIYSLTISSSLNYFYVPLTWPGFQIVSLSDLSLENSGVCHSSTHLIFFFILQSTLHLPQCSCNPHICVHDMVKQETPSEAESRQLLITAAATGGSI